MGPYRCLSALLVSLVTLHFYEPGVRGDGTVLIRFESYSNPGGKGSNGHCCDGKFSICQKNGCDHKFSVCLHPSNLTPDNSLSDLGSFCTYGLVATGKVKNQNTIDDFGDYIGHTSNPLSFNFDGELPPEASLVVKVVDDDHFSHDDFVERLSDTISFTKQDPKEGFRFTLSGRTTLVTTVSVECDSDWYGDACDVYCAPPNPKDNFMCDADTGEKICFPGVTGENCDQPVLPPTRTFPWVPRTTKYTRYPTTRTTYYPSTRTPRTDPTTRTTYFSWTRTPRPTRTTTYPSTRTPRTEPPIRTTTYPSTRTPWTEPTTRTTYFPWTRTPRPTRPTTYPSTRTPRPTPPSRTTTYPSTRTPRPTPPSRTTYPSVPQTSRTAIVTLSSEKPPRSTTPSAGLDCVSECSFLRDGDYRSCRGCLVFVTCSNGLTYDSRPCPAGTGWNNDFRRCEVVGTDCN